jgi:hypothetical protein
VSLEVATPLGLVVDFVPGTSAGAAFVLAPPQAARGAPQQVVSSASLRAKARNFSRETAISPGMDRTS